MSFASVSIPIKVLARSGRITLTVEATISADDRKALNAGDKVLIELEADESKAYDGVVRYVTEKPEEDAEEVDENSVSGEVADQGEKGEQQTGKSANFPLSVERGGRRSLLTAVLRSGFCGTAAGAARGSFLLLFRSHG